MGELFASAITFFLSFYVYCDVGASYQQFIFDRLQLGLCLCSEYFIINWIAFPRCVSFVWFIFKCVFHELIAGLSGSAPIAIGGGSMGDLFAAHERASAMALYSLGPLFGTLFQLGCDDSLMLYLGPVIGPVAGGYIAETIGVKYVFVVIAGEISKHRDLVVLLTEHLFI
jgi:MFS family permease